MTDPVLASARYVARQSLADLRALLEGLPLEALNWRPAGDDTNTIAVLATHTMGSTRSWLSVAVGAPLPDRDRDSEFRASASDADGLRKLVDEMSAACNNLLSSTEEVDWATLRKTHARPGDAPQDVPAAFALLHAIEHLREHVGHIGLTRQLWEASKQAGKRASKQSVKQANK